MSGRTLFSVGVLVATVVVVAVVLLSGGGDDDESSSGPAKTQAAESADRAETVGGAGTRSGGRAEETSTDESSEEKAELPQNPDETRGDQEIALTRTANLRRALQVLERRRQPREGVYNQLRVAPGRIDTVVETARKRLHLQVRPDFSIPFSSESDFPNDSDPEWRKDGLTARDVDPSAPSRMLRSIDRTRGGSAQRDIDYFVISRDIIDGDVRYGAYFRSGPQPRIVLLDDGKLRAVG